MIQIYLGKYLTGKTQGSLGHFRLVLRYKLTIRLFISHRLTGLLQECIKHRRSNTAGFVQIVVFFVLILSDNAILKDFFLNIIVSIDFSRR